MQKRESIEIPVTVVDEAFRAMLSVSSLLRAATYHNHDIVLIKKQIRRIGGIKAFDRKAGELFRFLPKAVQARLMER